MTPDEPLIGQLRDPDGETPHTGKWLAEVEREQEAELVQEVPSDVAFIVAGTDTERTARKLVQDGTAMQVMEHVLALYGLKMERSEDAEAIVELQSLHGSLYFREYWERDMEGNVTKHGKPVTDMPGWVVAFEESLRPKDEPTRCYVCSEVLEPGELIQPHKHPLTGAKLWRHVNDCAL